MTNERVNIIRWCGVVVGIFALLCLLQARTMRDAFAQAVIVWDLGSLQAHYEGQNGYAVDAPVLYPDNSFSLATPADNLAGKYLGFCPLYAEDDDWCTLIPLEGNAVPAVLEGDWRQGTYFSPGGWIFEHVPDTKSFFNPGNRFEVLFTDNIDGLPGLRYGYASASCVDPVRSTGGSLCTPTPAGQPPTPFPTPDFENNNIPLSVQQTEQVHRTDVNSLLVGVLIISLTLVVVSFSIEKRRANSRPSRMWMMLILCGVFLSYGASSSGQTVAFAEDNNAESVELIYIRFSDVKQWVQNNDITMGKMTDMVTYVVETEPTELVSLVPADRCPGSTYIYAWDDDVIITCDPITDNHIVLKITTTDSTRSGADKNSVAVACVLGKTMVAIAVVAVAGVAVSQVDYVLIELPTFGSGIFRTLFSFEWVEDLVDRLNPGRESQAIEPPAIALDWEIPFDATAFDMPDIFPDLPYIGDAADDVLEEARDLATHLTADQLAELFFQNVNPGSNFDPDPEDRPRWESFRKALENIAPIPIPTPDSDEQPSILYHYTSIEGFNGIASSQVIWPSLEGGGDAQWGNGQYFTDISPQDASRGSKYQLSRALYTTPWKHTSVTHFFAIDVTDIETSRVADVFSSTYGARGIYLSPSENLLSITGKIISSGPTPFKDSQLDHIVEDIR